MKYYTYTVRAALSVAFLLYFPSFSGAQVSIFANNITVQPEETFTIDITAKGFQDILTSQFSLTWDSLAFEFKGVDSLNQVFEDYPLDHFGFAQVSSGKLGFSWIDFSLGGVSIEDDGKLFSVRLKVLREESGDFIFGFGNDPTTVEIADIEENILEVDFNEGTITIDGISNTRNKNLEGLVQVSSFPNPFKEKAQADIRFLRPVFARITIHDTRGATLYQESANFQSGLHRLPLSRDIFPKAGVYILNVDAEGVVDTHKLIVY